MGKIILTDKRGRPQSYWPMYEGGQPPYTPRRSVVLPVYTRDAKEETTAYNWRQLLSSARYLYSNVGAVHGSINEIGTYSVGDAWLPRYTGSNPKWGEKAEAWLTNWFEICDVRGAPYDFRTSLFLTSVSIDRDGDNAMVLTQTDDNYPMVQFLPSHRVGARKGDARPLKDGPYKGLELYNGVVLNGQGRAVAYSILGDEQDGSGDSWVSARDMQLHFAPKWYDQGRGLTALAHAIKDWADYRDIRDFSKLGIKASSSIALIEQNETGNADQDAGAAHFNTAGAATTGITQETLDAGAIRYFRANSGSGLSVVKSERPSNQEQTFIEGQIMRGAYAGLEWPLEFSWNPERLGGANIRLIVAKAERTVAKRQLTLSKTFIRAVIYGVAKAIKLGLLPYDNDWSAWDAHLPAMITTDAGYASQAEVDEYTAGFTTLSDIYGKRGYDWQAKIRQRVQERKFLLDECTKAGVKPEDIQQIGTQKKPEPASTQQST